MIVLQSSLADRFADSWHVRSHMGSFSTRPKDVPAYAERLLAAFVCSKQNYYIVAKPHFRFFFCLFLGELWPPRLFLYELNCSCM